MLWYNEIGDNMKVIISAGGTGGHIYPALAIIDKIKSEDKNSEFLYIGTQDRMEKDIIPDRGIPFYGIEIYGLKRSLKPKNILFNIKAVINDKPVLFTAVYLCDDKEIGSSRDSINNYRYDYVVKDLSIGSHKLTSKASYEEDGASSTITATTSINVIE